MLTEILFEIYKLFSFTGIINKDFNDSLEKTENFSLLNIPFSSASAEREPMQAEWILLLEAIKLQSFYSFSEHLVSASGQS